MDQILEMTKELGAALQQDERFVRVQMAQAAADEDAELQKMIGEFNLLRMSLATEAQKEEHDDAKLEQLNNDIRALYARIMDNPSMKAFNEAKPALDALMSRISRILALAAQGEDPYQEEPEGGCTGSCSTCGGCH